MGSKADTDRDAQQQASIIEAFVGAYELIGGMIKRVVDDADAGRPEIRMTIEQFRAMVEKIKAHREDA